MPSASRPVGILAGRGTPNVAGGEDRVSYGDPFAAAGADVSGRSAIDWGVYGVPETFIVGRDARIAYKLVGPITPDNYVSTLKPQIEKALAAKS